ncbi:MAG: acetophenone carboxylase [Chloroflexi bacterium RBG_16_60_22]|nr:MAG: acetophenone carboxylase [Chloroflexi bacterium RBG_16_60_22]
MKVSLDVDIGGTFTDLFLNYDGKTVFTKTPTTGYNLSVGFMRAIRDAAKLLNISVKELLKNTEVVRYSTTIAMNTLLQRTGPRLALISTEGFEDIVPIGKGASWSDQLTFREIRNLARIVKPEPIISREMTVGVKERVNSRGEIIRPLDEEDFLEKLQYLVDRGARGFVVSLLFSYANPTHERRIAEIIRHEYPDFYLGAMPVVLSSEVAPKQNEYTRTVTTILNAYLHYSMWEQISGTGDELRNSGYDKVIMMVHNSGGMAEVFRTAAIQTFNGGPVAGLIGGANVGKILGYDNIVVSDMGGTSFDLGLVVAGSSRFYQYHPLIDRWWVDMTVLETRSIGAGGGSIAWLNPVMGKRLEVGPQGAGSMPGPASYNLGGTDPTVTDADIVLGYINPDYYHGGRMKLDKNKAVNAIKEKIADPLGVGVEEAALLIKKIVDANMGDVIAKETFLRGYKPADFILFAFGGAGPTHCCSYGPYAGINKIVVFPFSPVFCAFGSSTMDILHMYEQSLRFPLLSPVTMKPFEDYDVYNNAVKALQEKAIKDITNEGFKLESIKFGMEIEAKYGGQLNILRFMSPLLFINSEADVRKVYQAFEDEYCRVYNKISAYPQGGVDVLNLILRATVDYPKPKLPSYPRAGDVPDKEALKGKRDAYWVQYGAFRPTPIYEARLLKHGNIIEGEAVIEAEDTTIVLPPVMKLSVDQYHNFILEMK